MKDTFKNVLSFEFWQKFGKALMVVIAVMPAAGLMISIGKSLVMINPNFAPLVITGGVLEQIGWGVIVNLLNLEQGLTCSFMFLVYFLDGHPSELMACNLDNDVASWQ